jgi:hypothetical protein
VKLCSGRLPARACQAGVAALAVVEPRLRRHLHPPAPPPHSTVNLTVQAVPATV